MSDRGTVEFSVEQDENGQFCAHAVRGTWSLTTDGSTLDELHGMIEDLVRSYNSRELEKITSYAMVFAAESRVAA